MGALLLDIGKSKKGGGSDSAAIFLLLLLKWRAISDTLSTGLQILGDNSHIYRGAREDGKRRRVACTLAARVRINVNLRSPAIYDFGKLYFVCKPLDSRIAWLLAFYLFPKRTPPLIGVSYSVINEMHTRTYFYEDLRVLFALLLKLCVRTRGDHRDGYFIKVI